MPDQGIALNRDAFERTKRAVWKSEAQPATLPGDSTSETMRPHQRPPIRVVFLEDMPERGAATAAVCRFEGIHDVQEIRLFGEVDAAATLTITFNGETTAPFSANADAATVQAALEALDGVEAGDIIVDKYPGSFILEFKRLFAADAPDLVTITKAGFSVAGGVEVKRDVWVDSGQVESIRQMLPVGSPTPIVAGAAGLAVWYHRAGYGLHALECRDFSLITYNESGEVVEVVEEPDQDTTPDEGGPGGDSEEPSDDEQFHISP